MDDLRFVVEVLAADTMGEIVAHQLLDAVFQHVTDDEGDEQRKRQRAELPLEGEAHDGGEEHRDPGGDAEVELFHDHAVPPLRGAEVEVALDVFLQGAEAMNEYAVVRTVPFPDRRVAHSRHVLPDPAVERDRLAGQLIQLPDPQPLDEFKNMPARDVAEKFVTAKVHPHHTVWDCRSVDDRTQPDIFLANLPRVGDEAFAQGFRVRADAVLLDVGQLVTQGAFDDGREHLDLVLIVGDQGAGRVRGHPGEGLADAGKRHSRAFGDLPEQEDRSYQTDVRLDILVEHVLGIGGPVDVEASGQEEPHRQREVVHPQLLTGDKADFQLYRVTVVYSWVYLDHIQLFFRSSFRLAPGSVGMPGQERVVVALVSGDLLAEPGRLPEGFVWVGELHLGDRKSLVVTVELVHFEGVGPDLHKVAGLVDDSRLADSEKFPCVIYRNLLLPLKTAHAALVADTLDGDVALVVLHPHADSSFRNAAEIALSDPDSLERFRPEVAIH